MLDVCWIVKTRYNCYEGATGGEVRATARQARRVPADVRRVASACTLRVIYGGHVPQWKATRAKMLAYVEVIDNFT